MESTKRCCDQQKLNSKDQPKGCCKDKDSTGESKAICSKSKEDSCDTIDQAKESSCLTSKCCSNPSSTVIKGLLNQSVEKDVLVVKPTCIEMKSELAQFRVQGMTCTGCENTLSSALIQTNGVLNLDVSMFLERATVWYDPTVTNTEALLDVIINKSGFKAFIETLDDISMVKFILQCEPTSQIDKVLQGRSGIRGYQLQQNILYLDLDLDEIGARDVRNLLALHGISVDYKPKEPLPVPKVEWDQARLIVAVICSIPTIILCWIFPDSLEIEIGRHVTIKSLVLWILATLVQSFVAWPVYTGAWNGIYYSKELNMDSLVVLSTSVAYFYSSISLLVGVVSDVHPEELFFETSIILLSLILLGRYLQGLARKKATDTMNELKELGVETVTILENGVETEIDTKWIQRGDLVVVRPFGVIPSDGIVVKGTSEVDESILAGEGIPVCKKENDRVIGGTTNISGQLIVRMTHLLEENMVSHISRLIKQAQSSKARTQYFADMIAGWFTPLVIVIAIIVYVVWIVVAQKGLIQLETTPSLYALGFAIAVLVVSCPCAVALAVPTVIVVGAGVAAKNGILVKNAEIFKIVCNCRTIIFDKTGTLTVGNPQVVDVWHQFEEEKWNEIKEMIGVGAACSLHPIAKAVAAWCSPHPSSTKTLFEAKEIP